MCRSVLDGQPLHPFLEVDHLLVQIAEHDLLDVAQHDDLLLDDRLHFLNALLDPLVALIDRRYLMELVLNFAEDAVGAQQFVLSFAEDGNHAVVLKTPDLVARPDEHRVRVESMSQLLPIATQPLLDAHLCKVLLLGRRAGC